MLRPDPLSPSRRASPKVCLRRRKQKGTCRYWIKYEEAPDYLVIVTTHKKYNAFYWIG